MHHPANIPIAPIILTFLIATAILCPAQTTNQDTLKILCFGDLFLGSWAVDAIDTNGADYPFCRTRPLLQSADLTMANLEGPFTTCTDTFLTKEYAFKMPPRICKGLAPAGITALNLANNHILDFGFPGLEETTATLSSHGILSFGVGKSFSEAYQPARLTIKHTNLAIFGYSTTFPKEFWADSTHGGTAFPYRELVIDALTSAQNYSNLIIVHVHWGAELHQTPKPYQTELAHLLVDYGADVVFGHHAHVPLGVEIYQGVPVFYGLGNYAFASYSQNAKGMAGEVTFVGDSLIAGKIIPLNVTNEEVEFRPTILTGDAKQQFIQHVASLSDSLNNYKKIFDMEGNLLLAN
jgi:poly-gamma-glutamate capsule biosynthesis protein CapA/YwtB (metallophosphatase superfamily)